MTAPQKEVLYIRGWNVGFQKVAFTALMRSQVGVSLEAAKNLTDKVLAGETVTVWVWNHAIAAKLCCELGAVVLDRDGEICVGGLVVKDVGDHDTRDGSDGSNSAMTNAISSAKIISLQITGGILKAVGILLIILAVFWTALALLTPKGFHGGGGLGTGSVILILSLMLIDGIGFLLPKRLVNLLSSLLLFGAGVVLFRVDAFRWDNWWIYCLFSTQLLLTLWLFRENGALPLREVSNAN
jgi:hypothetical protein